MTEIPGLGVNSLLLINRCTDVEHASGLVLGVEVCMGVNNLMSVSKGVRRSNGGLSSGSNGDAHMKDSHVSKEWIQSTSAMEGMLTNHSRYRRLIYIGR